MLNVSFLFFFSDISFKTDDNSNNTNNNGDDGSSSGNTDPDYPIFDEETDAHEIDQIFVDDENFKTKMTICIVIPLLYGVVYHLICVRHKYQQASTVALILIVLMFVESLISTRSN